MTEICLVTVHADPETGLFPPRPLAHVEGEVVSVVEHFYLWRERPTVLLVVQVRAGERRDGGRHGDRGRGGHGRGGEGQGAEGRLRDDGPRAQLTAEEQVRYDRLRAWRKSRSTADGVPPYVVLNNQQMAVIARRVPVTLAQLQAVEGFGEAKAARYGEDVLAVIGVHTVDAPPGVIRVDNA